MNFVSKLFVKSGQVMTKVRGLSQIKLVLYTKEDCSLCDEAKDLIEEMYPEKFLIEEVDITKNNREIFRKYKLDIPVFHHDGKFLMKHRVDTKALDDLIKNHNS